jgi:alkanesulfonate monooxygenase
VQGHFEGQAPARVRGAGLTEPRTQAYTYYDYLFQVARAAEVSGFGGVLIPWQAEGEDPWIIASALVRGARRLTFVPELELGFATPVYLAKMSVSFQRLSRNRLGWKFDLEREQSVRRAHGDTLAGEAWFARADEYLSAAKGVWTTRPYDFAGSFYQVEAGGFEGPLAGRPLPPIYTSGRSDAALGLAAKHSDVHLFDPLPLDELKALVRGLNARASALGRNVHAGIRLGVVARHTESEAAAAVSSTADVVGSYERVAARLTEYLELGIEHLILQGEPHLEEAYRLGEHVLPRLRSRVGLPHSGLAVSA